MNYFVKVKDSNRDHFRRINVVISETVTDLLTDLHLKFKGKVVQIFTVTISLAVTEQILQLPTYNNSLTGFGMVHSQLTLTHSKGHS